MKEPDLVKPISILTGEFAMAAAEAGLRARQIALANGHPVVFLDQSERYVKELPDGTRVRIRFHAGEPREKHVQVIGIIPPRTS